MREALATQIYGEAEKNYSLRAGFEPAHGNRIGFQVQRLNHSAIAATVTIVGE